jgi:hypothetical protein
MVKLSIAADESPEFVTLALEPAAPVVVAPTVTLAAAPPVSAIVVGKGTETPPAWTLNHTPEDVALNGTV